MEYSLDIYLILPTFIDNNRKAYHVDVPTRKFKEYLNEYIVNIKLNWCQTAISKSNQKL